LAILKIRYSCLLVEYNNPGFLKLPIFAQKFARRKTAKYCYYNIDPQSLRILQGQQGDLLNNLCNSLMKALFVKKTSSVAFVVVHTLWSQFFHQISIFLNSYSFLITYVPSVVLYALFAKNYTYRKCMDTWNALTGSYYQYWTIDTETYVLKCLRHHPLCISVQQT
jgi:hypothetical protein